MNTFIWGRRGLPRKQASILLFILVGYCLSAQESPIIPTPIKSLNVVALRVGNPVPKNFWDQTHLLFENGTTKEITLKEYKGKLLVLDFWSVGCANCIFHQKAMNHFRDNYKEEMAIIMVNPIRTKDDLLVIQNFEKRNAKHFPNGLKSIILDSYLQDMFLPVGFPMYIWINKHGLVETISYKNLLNKEISAPFITKPVIK